VVVYERAVRFEEVDAAGIVFFGRFAGWAHEAMEHFFDVLDGGYSGLILRRRVGLPAVDVKMTFRAPARYGDRLRIATSVARIGNRSATLRYRVRLAPDDVEVAVVEHTVVTTDLATLTSTDMPADVRARLLEHVETP
jgi:4-hydroxybenzoyl-CoA thioesterase